MLKFFKLLIWRLKHRNIKLSEVRNMVEAQKFFESYPRTSFMLEHEGICKQCDSYSARLRSCANLSVCPNMPIVRTGEE